MVEDWLLENIDYIKEVKQKKAKLLKNQGFMQMILK